VRSTASKAKLTPVFIAVHWLLQSGSLMDEKDSDGDTACLMASQSGFLEPLQWLLQNGASINEKNNKGKTASLNAAFHGHLEMIQWLLQNGASIGETQ